MKDLELRCRKRPSERLEITIFLTFVLVNVDATEFQSAALSCDSTVCTSAAYDFPLVSLTVSPTYNSCSIRVYQNFVD